MEAGGYGPNVIEGSIMNGGHYNRALEGMSVLAESISRLLLKEFFISIDATTYQPHLQILFEMKKFFSTDCEGSISFLKDFISIAGPLQEKYKQFIKERSETNENFRLWVSILDKIQIVHDFIRADREGDWNLHLDAMQRALYVLAAWDAVHYFRWGSFYLEDMRKLAETSETVYEHFMKGRSFSVRKVPPHQIYRPGSSYIVRTIRDDPRTIRDDPRTIPGRSRTIPDNLGRSVIILCFP